MPLPKLHVLPTLRMTTWSSTTDTIVGMLVEWAIVLLVLGLFVVTDKDCKCPSVAPDKAGAARLETVPAR